MKKEELKVGQKVKIVDMEREIAVEILEVNESYVTFVTEYGAQGVYSRLEFVRKTSA